MRGEQHSFLRCFSYPAVRDQAPGIQLDLDLVPAFAYFHAASDPVQWNRIAVAIEDNAAAAAGADGPEHSRLVGQGRQQFKAGLFLLEHLNGFAAGFTMNADIGDGAQPLQGSGIDGLKRSNRQAGEKILFDIADAILNPAFSLALQEH